MNQTIFLQTKLQPSQVAPRCLKRARLFEALQREQSVRLLLVTGPAGSGKSTLLADYLSQTPDKAAWLGLEQDDQEPSVFFHYFIEAIARTFPGSLDKTREYFKENVDFSDQTTWLGILINDLVAYHKTITIVLDDYHQVNQQSEISAFFTVLLRRGPSNLTIMMTSRDQPDLPLAWLRSKRLLTEVHQSQLRFTVAETSALFRGIWAQPLDEDLVAKLVEKTEGWATGLQLVAHAVRGRNPQDIRRYVLELEGADASIFDYLAAEVFDAQPQPVQEFLKCTALPDTFNVSLAEELVPGCDACAMIKHLKVARLFLVELDRDEKWFRYHHLFRDFLRSKLNRDRRRSRVEGLHHRAAQWFFEQQDTVAAMPHFLHCGNPQLASEILETVASDLIHKGLKNSVKRWVEQLPAGLGAERPGLLVLQAELHDLQGQWPRAVELYKSALRTYRQQDQSNRVAEVLEKLSLCYIKYGENKQLLDSCEEGLKLCPEDNLSLRALLESWLGATLINSGNDFERGYALLRSSHSLAFECREPRAISWASLTYGFVYHFPQGNFAEALRTLNEGIDFFTRLGWALVIYQLAMNKAFVQVVQGEPKAAQVVIEETVEQARAAGHSFVEKGLETLRSMAFLESRRLNECRQSLERVSQSEIPAQFKPTFFKIRMLLNTLDGNFGQAKVDAEEMERSMILNGAGLYGPECLVSLSYMLARQGEFREAERKAVQCLDLCRRAQAKFWQMKTLQVLAWIALRQGNATALKQSLESSLQLALVNDYTSYWLNNAWELSLPLLLAARAYQIEVGFCERLLARLGNKNPAGIEDLLQHEDPILRRCAINFLGLPQEERLRQHLRQLHREDPQSEVREAARRALQIQGERIQFFLLGPLRIKIDGEAFDVSKSIRPQGQKLLKFFLTQGERIVASERILETFWPDLEPDKGRHNLATHISALRRAFQTQSLFTRIGDGYRLCGPGEVGIDVLEFEKISRTGLEAARSQSLEEACYCLQRAEGLYHGDFLLEDLYEDWIERRRCDLRQSFEDLLEKVADLLSRHQQFQEAIPRYRRLLESPDPSEQVIHKLLRCYQNLGDQASARRDYDAYCQRLRDSLGLEPQPATRALLESLFLS